MPSLKSYTTQAIFDQKFFRLSSLIKAGRIEKTSDQTFMRPKKSCDINATVVFSDETVPEPTALWPDHSASLLHNFYAAKFLVKLLWDQDLCDFRAIFVSSKIEKKYTV